MRPLIVLVLLCCAFLLGTKVTPTKQDFSARQQKEYPKLSIPPKSQPALPHQDETCSVSHNTSHYENESCPQLCAQQERVAQRELFAQEYVSSLEKRAHIQLTQDERKDIEALVVRGIEQESKVSELTFLIDLQKILGAKTLAVFYSSITAAEEFERERVQQRLFAILSFHLDVPKSGADELKRHIEDYFLLFAERRPDFVRGMSLSSYTELLKKAHAETIEEYFSGIFSPSQLEELRALNQMGVMMIN